MKKLSTLNLFLVTLTLLGGQVAAVCAWQKSANSAEIEEKKADAPVESTESDPEAVDLLRQARNRLFERHSVQAEMTQVVNLGDYRVRSSGTYAAAAGFRYRLQYQIKLGDVVGEFLEVCDGQLLHTKRQITPVQGKFDGVVQPETELTRRDIQKIHREALGLKDENPTADLSDALRAAEIGIGGLPAILAMLERTQILDPVRVQAIDGQEYLILQGRLRPDRQAELLAGLGPTAGQVSGFLPDVIRVYISKTTLFPEKFVYLKRGGEKGNDLHPMITIEFSRILLDQQIAEGQFIYMAPPGLEERDETAMYLQNMQAAAKAATAPEQTPSPATNPPAEMK